MVRDRWPKVAVNRLQAPALKRCGALWLHRNHGIQTSLLLTALLKAQRVAVTMELPYLPAYRMRDDIRSVRLETTISRRCPGWKRGGSLESTWSFLRQRRTLSAGVKSVVSMSRRLFLRDSTFGDASRCSWPSTFRHRGKINKRSHRRCDGDTTYKARPARLAEKRHGQCVPHQLKVIILPCLSSERGWDASHSTKCERELCGELSSCPAATFCLLPPSCHSNQPPSPKKRPPSKRVRPLLWRSSAP